MTRTTRMGLIGSAILALAALLATLALVGRAAAATPITIDNPGFEDLVLADQDFTLGDIAGAWTAPGRQGEFNPNDLQYPGGVIPEGDNVAFSNGGTISQTLGDSLTPGLQYTLSVQVAFPLDVDPAPPPSTTCACSPARRSSTRLAPRRLSPRASSSR